MNPKINLKYKNEREIIKYRNKKVKMMGFPFELYEWSALRIVRILNEIY